MCTKCWHGSVTWKSSKKKKKETKKKGADLYALLGLKNERFLATPKMLKDGMLLFNVEKQSSFRVSKITVLCYVYFTDLLLCFSYTAYRKVCLESHPDKRLVGVEDEDEKEQIEEYFKQIQDAYAVRCIMLICFMLI